MKTLDSNQIVSQCECEAKTFFSKELLSNQMKTIKSLFFKVKQNKRNLTKCKSDREAKFTNKVTMLTAKKFRECLKEEKSGLTCVFIQYGKDQILFLHS